MLSRPGRASAAPPPIKTTAGRSPIDENHFYLSFRGLAENEFSDSVVESHHEKEWDTTPWNFPSNYKRSKRDACWLGLDCK